MKRPAVTPKKKRLVPSQTAGRYRTLVRRREQFDELRPKGEGQGDRRDVKERYK